MKPTYFLKIMTICTLPYFAINGCVREKHEPKPRVDSKLVQMVNACMNPDTWDTVRIEFGDTPSEYLGHDGITPTNENLELYDLFVRSFPRNDPAQSGISINSRDPNEDGGYLHLLKGGKLLWLPDIGPQPGGDGKRGSDYNINVQKLVGGS